MPSNPILTPAWERAISASLDSLRNVAIPNLKLMRAIGRPDEELEVHVQQQIQGCEGAIELNELSKLGPIT